jgi:hypothetical protein
LRHAVLAAAAAALCAGPLVLAAGAAPTCTGSIPTSICGDRVIAPALRSATFLQYQQELAPALKAIEAQAPRFVEVKGLDQWLSNKKYVSAGGRKMWVVRVTNEAVKGPKRNVAVSLSVHGNEPAGREGGIRYLEDLALWATKEPGHRLYSGNVSRTVKDVLSSTVLYAVFSNPDGWAAGDLTEGGALFSRTNDNGTDLNREYRTKGWTNRPATPMSDPEAQGWAAFLKRIGPLSTASDIHGELNSENDAFADLMWPAAQWTPRRQAQELQLGVHMVDTIKRKWAQEGVLLNTPLGLTGVMSPSQVATAYDVVGYDDGGFMGDYFAQSGGAVEIDAENFLSHTVPNNLWVGALEQAHVAGVKGIIESLLVESMVTDRVKPRLNLGKVAYAYDPKRVTSKDGLGFTPLANERPQPYDASRMRYFDDLRAAANKGAVVQPLASADIASGAARLSRYDSLVLDDVAVPVDSKGRSVDLTAYVRHVVDFVRGGGQLVLTDAAVPFLTRFGFRGIDQRTAKTDGGHIDFGAHTDPWEQDLISTASQTYYEVPLGFPPTGSAPHYGIASAAWAARGGTTVGTVAGPATGETAAGDFTALGHLPFGKGRVSIFGAVLPKPTEDYPHVEGLADYGVTITGGQVLNRILSFRRH